MTNHELCFLIAAIYLVPEFSRKERAWIAGTYCLFGIILLLGGR